MNNQELFEEAQKNLTRFFGINEAEGNADPAVTSGPGSQVQQAGGASQDAGGGQAAAAVDPNQPAADANNAGDQEQPGTEQDENEQNIVELKKKVLELMNSGQIPEDLIVSFLEKEGHKSSDVKKALNGLKDDGKIDKVVTWARAGEEVDSDETGIDDEAIEGDVEEVDDQGGQDGMEDMSGAGDMQAPESPAQAPADATGTQQAPGGAGTATPMSMRNRNYMEADDEDDDEFDDVGDEDFDDFDDEFDDLEDEDEDDMEDEDIGTQYASKIADEEDGEGEEDPDLDDVIDDVDDIKVLLRSIEPKLKKLKDRTSAAKSAMKKNAYTTYTDGSKEYY